MNILHRTESSSAYFYSKKQDLDVQNNYAIHIIGDLTCCEPLEKYIWVELIPTENNTVK
jgi:hypothetical protein